MQSCFIQLHKHTIVDLQQTEELQDFSRFGMDAVNTEKIVYMRLKM